MTDELPPFADEARRRRLEAGAEVIRQHATADLELECPPTGVPIGEGLRRIRRRNRLIDWLVTVLIVATPLALVLLGVLSLSVNDRAERAARRADAAAVNGAAARDAAADAETAADAAKASLAELQATNDRLASIVDAFALLATATTPEDRAAARAAIDAASTPPSSTTSTTTRRSSSSSSSSSTTTAPPSSTTSTSSPPPTTTTTRPPLACIGGVCLPG